ncbi:hypothetical protein OIDMADRAFT_61013 [Oidiodendron maius Zn]|uniref:Uncharacterized protein n=1 Tax=Oidiodendron maius (strain Zn) TaxID=913774 RepID=A0A0C3CWW7_OIDMZ|nr:hypothetical protein OIDMADRAFT_61013 [Oidiodendron maius Zn]
MLTADQDIDGLCEAGTKFLTSRVRSFASDPLHSAAYLSNLSGYLTKPFRKPAHRARYNIPTPPLKKGCTFFYSYEILGPRPSKPVTYDNASSFLSHSGPSSPHRVKSELIFLTGCSSPEWLNVIVFRYGVDHRFLHRHLDFLPSGQRDWYTAPDVPSRSEHFIRLLLPSIVFLGSEDRYVSIKELHKARNACADQLRQKSKNLFGGSQSSTGHSIIRQVNIHSGDAIVLEQAISITVLNHQDTVKVLVWTDSGSDVDSKYIPVPNVESFHNVADAISFCPVFFERELTEWLPSSGEDSKATYGRQPLSVLPTRYGETLDWSQFSEDPILILQELFNFQSAAAIQYLNMLRKTISQLTARTQPIDDGRVNMEDILHFEYAKTVLVRWSAHFRGLMQALDAGPLRNDIASLESREKRTRMLLSLKRDLEFLENETKTITELCDSGKSTILSNFSISEARRTTEEARLVTELTKATTRLTFIFLPISFVTSVFGMNFQQFGQGSLSIWLWVQVTLPLLAVCIIMVEWGRTIMSYSQRLCSSAFEK